MPSTISNAVVCLNDGALNYFLGGDFVKAIAMFQLAFETVSANSPYDADTLQLFQIDGEYHYIPVPLPLSRFYRCELPAMTACDIDKILKERLSHNTKFNLNNPRSSPESAYFMYNRAFVLSKDLDDYSLLVLQHHQTSAIILYNLALVHHNIGLHLGVTSALSHALKLYELSLETIDRGSIFLDVQKLLLAILNNMGNIYIHLHNLENARRCLDSLRVVLVTSNTITVEDIDYEFFFLNAMFQGNGPSVAAAA